MEEIDQKEVAGNNMWKEKEYIRQGTELKQGFNSTFALLHCCAVAVAGLAAGSWIPLESVRASTNEYH